MRKLGGLSRCSGAVKSRIDLHVFDIGQLMNLENNHVTEGQDMENWDLNCVSVVTWHT